MTESLPLFPLHTQLLPQQRLDLQIFEPRYLQMVKDCLRAETSFGVVMIREGAEVVRTSADVPQVFGVGVSAKIVDWGTTDTGWLAVTIMGQVKFKLSSASMDANKLMSADISWLPVEAIVEVPRHHAGLLELLLQLRQHPATARLQLPDITDARHLGWQLSQLLPLPKPLKVDLLSMVDPLQRLDQLLPLIEDLSEGR